MENRRSVDQKLDEVRNLLLARGDLFCHQGAVVATWRTYQGRRLGPYFRLSYRDGGRQHTVYLGKSPELATQVQELLTERQHRHRVQRQLERLRSAARASLAAHKQQWEQQLRRFGLHAQGHEVRGWRRLRQSMSEDIIPSDIPSDCQGHPPQRENYV